MKTAIGKIIGTGARGISFNPGFVPKAIFIATDAAQYFSFYSEGIWCGRTNTLGANDSFIDGVRVVGNTVYLGSDARVNASGSAIYWAAIGDDGSQDFEILRWMGNATAGRVVSTQKQDTPIAVIAKRDSTRTGVIKVAGATTTSYLDGTSPTDCISSLGTGSITVTAANEVNEYNSAGGLGEGIEGIAFFNSPNFQTVSWANTSSGQVVPTTVDPLFALVFRTDGTGGLAYFMTRDMARVDFAKPLSNAALTVNIGGVQAGGIRMGSATSIRTGGFSALVFGRREASEKQTPAIIVRNRKGIYFPGRGVASQVVCGNSDATLRISGAISIEWFGSIWGEASTPGSDMTMLSRGVGPATTAGAYSWGLGGLHKTDFGWSGPQVTGIVNSVFDVAAPLDTAVWRTGVLIPQGKPTHYLLTHNGSGRWRLYINGVLTRQRDYNVAPGVVGGAGHYTVFGMRPNTGGTYTNAQRMIAMAGRVYSRELSMSEVVTRYQIEALGSSASQDVTSGLAENWVFNSASGSVLPASVNAGNNGTISANAVIVSL